jgi:hypothetical protein
MAIIRVAIATIRKGARDEASEDDSGYVPAINSAPFVVFKIP